MGHPGWMKFQSDRYFEEMREKWEREKEWERSRGQSRSTTQSTLIARTVQYSIYNDESLLKINSELSNIKSRMCNELHALIKDYKNTRDKNETLMQILGITVVAPLVYYVYKGLIAENLPYNRAKQCELLREITKAFGTTSERGRDFIQYQIFHLFKTLKDGNNITLMPLLLAVYGTAKKVHNISLPLIDQYKELKKYGTDFDIIKYFELKDKKTRELPVAHLKDITECVMSSDGNKQNKDEAQSDGTRFSI